MELGEIYQSYVTLLPDKDVVPEFRAIKSQLNKALNEDVEAQIRTCMAENEDIPYSEGIMYIDCNFGKLETNTIITRWCEKEIFEGIGESRLVLKKALTIETIKTRNEKVNVESFSFGSLVGMNLFVEHYNSSWSKNSLNKRITQLRVDFIHDFSKIVFRFIVAKKELPKVTQDGRSHRLHCLELNYSSIQSIIIRETVSHSKMIVPKHDIFLQVSASPLLKKLDKKQEDLDDKEFYDEHYFPYVSSNEHATKTPLMRAVSFGGGGDDDDDDYDNNDTRPSAFKDKDVKLQNKSVPQDDPKMFIPKPTGNKNKKKKNKKTNSNPTGSLKNTVHAIDIREDIDAYCSSKTLGMCRTIKLQLVGENSFDAIKQLITCCDNQVKVYFAPIKEKELKKVPPNPSVPSTFFNCFYALKCIVSSSYIIPDELYIKNQLSEVNKLLKTMAEENSFALEKALYDIYKCLDKGFAIKFKESVTKIFQTYKESSTSTASKKESPIPDKMVEMRRAIITPTRFIFLPPVPQLKSSLLQRCDTDYAIRVTARDDNFDQLTFTLCGSKNHKLDFLKKHIGDHLAAGFKIGSRTYEFLGSSTSQLREHGNFFYAKDKLNQTAQDLRLSIGDVTSINNVPKFMARMGQSFSQAITRIKLERKFVEGPTDDIKTKDGKYNFTDGIGKISPVIAQMIYKVLDLDPDDTPSAFQIRYGGCKGMLLVDPTLGSEKKVIFRESQWKFDSDQDSLEILKVSKPQRAFLNRPFITILEQMGVNENVILELQTQVLNSLIGSLVNSNDAMSILKERATLRLPYSRLHYCGFDFSAEPFFKPMVMFLHRQAISELKHKARILLPFEKCRTMLGVADETRTLEYGQVFFQYTDINIEGAASRTVTPYTGTVLITKNPCMHPGDVRKFEAVYVEKLNHIKDCIVFPTKGPRPHPDEMAGSDLDGDEYVIIWHDNLFFERENHDPMDYSNDIEVIKNDNIKVQDMTDFLCQYIVDDCVGLIASSHLALADRESIFDPKLIKIAKKYSVTLDFAKSGKPETLDPNEKPPMYPDFMEKFQSRKSYLSDKCLGKLYRNCKRIEMVSEMLDDEVEIELDEDLIVEGWEEYEDNAREMLNEYIRLLMEPAKMFNITKEGEIMSGAVRKIEKTFQGKNDKENIDLALNTIIPNVFNKCKQMFMEEFLAEIDHLPQLREAKFKSKKDKANHMIQEIFNEASKPKDPSFNDSNNVIEKMLKKISAWYVVAYETKKNNSSCLGLPWTVPALMGLLKAKSTLKKIKLVPKSEQKVGIFIDKEVFNDEVETENLNPPIIAQKVVCMWVQHYDDFLTLRGLRNESKYVKNLIKSKVDIYLKAAPKASAAQLVLSFFIDMSKLCYCYTSNADEKRVLNNWRDRELGMLALVTLSNISSSGKLWLTDSPDNISSIIRMGNLTRDFREQIIFPLDVGKPTNDGKFSKGNFKTFLNRNENLIKSILKNMSRVKNMELDYRDISGGNFKRYCVILTVYGKCWCIESLKEFVIQPNFAVILMKTAKEELSLYPNNEDLDSKKDNYF